MKQKMIKGLMIVICLFVVSSIQVDASTKKETKKFNGDFKHAQTLGTNDTVNGRIDDEDKDYYKIKVPKGSAIELDLKFTSYIMRNVNFIIYNSKGEEVFDIVVFRKVNLKKTKKNYTLYLNPDTYYIGVEYYSFETGKYQISMKSKKVNNDDLTKNTTKAKAKKIDLDKTYKGVLALGNEKDLYKFDILEAGTLNVKISSYMKELDFYLLDKEGNKLDYRELDCWGENTKSTTYNTMYYFEVGTYYFQISDFDWESGGIYKISTIFEPIETNEKENNDTFKNATTINNGQVISGLIGENEESDMFKIKINSNGQIHINLTSYLPCVYLYVYDINGNMVFDTYLWLYGDTEIGQQTYEPQLDSGTYYIQVKKDRLWTGAYKLVVTHRG